MSGRRAASRADEDLSPDQSRPALTATAGPVLKLDGSPPPPSRRSGSLPHGWTQPRTILPVVLRVASMSPTHRCAHTWTHAVTLRRAVRWLGITRALTGG